MDYWTADSIDRARRPRLLSLSAARWLLSTLSWCPFMGWVAWPLWDGQLELNPWIAAAGGLAFAANWVYSGWSGARDRRWNALLAAGAVFAVSYSVASHAGSIGAFLAISTSAWALAHSVVGGLISTWAADADLVRSYRAAEETILRSVMVTEGALFAGVTTARVGGNVGSALFGLAGGALLGGIVAWFIFALVYAVMNVVLALIHGE
ncbi:MAG: hypothetical protein ACK2VA_15780 [Anaerolineae bacterium]